MKPFFMVFYYCVFCVSILVLTNCIENNGKAVKIKSDAVPVQVVSPMDASVKMAHESWVVVDVRSPEEYAAGYISKAVNLDVNDPDFSKKVAALDKSKSYILYCRTGRRSASAAKIFREQGVSNVLEIKGGITDWQSAELPVIR